MEKMNLTSSNTCEKVLFKVKPLRGDGLVLNVHPKATISMKNVRFVIASFHQSEKIVALADNNSNIFLIDYGSTKFWKVPPHSCSSIEFSIFNTSELFLGLFGGDIKIMNFESGISSDILKGHKHNVKHMSFAEKYQFLSFSQEEAIIWDLRTNSMLQVLDLERKFTLKYACFVPFSSNILACFHDDVIQIWSGPDYQAVKNFTPSNWKNCVVKTIAFTKNGQIMVVAGYTPQLALFFVDGWKLYKFIDLSDYIQTVRQVAFISQPFDAGFNKLLAILSQRGILYFYDSDKNIMISELKAEFEIKHFTICSKGIYAACLLHCGDTGLYNLQQYVMECANIKPEGFKSKKRKLSKDKEKKQTDEVKYELDSILNRKKLRPILEEYGEYPEAYRLKIWEHLLDLPNNYEAYNNLTNHITTQGFEDLSKMYPIESKLSITALKKLLSNVVAWCQFFANIEFMPVFIFPIVKVFQNKPVTCFEAVCTILLNWCQHWFEYHPLAPFNVLAIIENILYEHDPELLNFFTNSNLSSSIYAWPLLATNFSEVLSVPDWLKLWDHIFTNEVSFLLCAVAAYSIVQRDHLMKMKNVEEFKCFYGNQNSVDMKRFLRTAYFLLNNVSEAAHPRQYLKDFQALGKGLYPIFKGYPNFLFDLQGNINELETDLTETVKNENEILLRWKKEQVKKMKAEQRLHEHHRRVEEMEKALSERIRSKENLLRAVSNKLFLMKSFVESANGKKISNPQ